MKRLSTPNELQAAIDGNKREGRRTGYDTYSMFPGPRPQVPLPPSSLPLPQISPLPPGLRPSFNGQGSPFLSEYLLSTYIGYFINLTEKFVKRVCARHCYKYLGPFICWETFLKCFILLLHKLNGFLKCTCNVNYLQKWVKVHHHFLSQQNNHFFFLKARFSYDEMSCNKFLWD